MKISTNKVMIFALIAIAGLIGVIAVDILMTSETEAKSVCAGQKGAFRNGANGILCPLKE